MWWSEGSDPPGGQTQAPAQNMEVKELQDQFEQQQTLIAQLKEMLRKNEQQLVTKEKEVEEYATKLSGIKSRVSKRGRSKIEKSESTVQENVPDAVQQDVATVDTKDEELKSTGKRKVQRGNLILLRKQLEENRIKCEQRNKEVTKNKRGIEEMVEHLRSQLEEREQTIQELKGEFNTRLLAAASLTQTVPTADVSQPFEIPEGMPPECQIQELHSQITLRDNRITELNGKIIELENTIIDLQENLKEKDSVIEARTKAITLMSEDLSRKSKATLDTLDETREEMRTMQQNFVALEANMKREKDDLNKQLEAKNKRLQQMEERNKMLESTRFELSTRNAELQERVVLLQSELQKQSEESHVAANVRALEEALEEANREISNLKANLHENKIQHTNEDIELLHQRIAELEEDKGNLQLHLVDFDDLKGSEAMWKQKVVELEDRVKQQSLDLDSHLHALSLIESEKLDLMQALQEKSHEVSSLKAEVENLQQTISENENCKITAELKAVELEEQVDVLLKQKDDLVSELENTKTALVQFHNQPLKTEEQFSNQFSEKYEKWDVQELSEKEEKDSSNLEISLKPLESEFEHARKTIAEQKEIISELNEKLRQREEEMELQLEIISKLEHLGEQAQEREERNEDGNKISEIVKELGEMAGDLNEWKKRCSEVEDRLEQLGNEKEQLEKHLEEVINENQVITTQLRFQKEISEELEAKLSEQCRIVATREEAINKLKDTVKELQRALESKDVALLEVSQKLQELELQVDKQHQELGTELACKTQELNKLSSEYLELKLAFNDKEQELHSFNILMQNLSVQVDDVINRIVLDRVDEKNSVCGKLESALSLIAEKCDSLILENQTLRATVEEKNISLEEISQKMSYMEKVSAEFEENFEIQKQKDDELSNVKEELSRKLDELSNKDKAIKELEQKITEQISKNKKLAKCLKAKAVVVRNYEEKEKLWEATNQSKEQNIAVEKSAQENVIAQYESEVLSLHKELQEKSDDLRKYTEKCSEFENEISKLTQTCTELQQQLHLLSEERNNTSCIIQEMNDKMKEREEKISILMQDINKLHEEIAANDKLKNELAEENKNILMKRVELENELEDLHSKLSLKEADLIKKSDEVETITKINAENEAKLSELQLQVERLSGLEESTAQRNARIVELEEQIRNMSENYHMSSSAMEAKLQEREAYLEALEQELSKSRERAAHLEEGLCNMEERRRSLEVKFETLRDMLMEADRKKEEVEESEELLEAQISKLMKSVETFKKRLYETEEENGDLNKKICEMKDENESLQKSLLSAEMTTKNLQKDVERLSSFEVSYTSALEKIESLEIELKQSAAEYAHNLKERNEKEKSHRETLESDLRSLSHQLEISENEKRYVAEQLEKLNDVKVALEEEIDLLNENLRLSSSRISELEEEMKFKSTADKQLSEETVTVCHLCTDHQKVQQEAASISDNIVTNDEECNDSKLSKDEYIKNLSVEIDSLKMLLSQKDNELHTYQQRLLQLQFGANQGAPISEVCEDAFPSVNKNTASPSFQEARSEDMDKTVSALSEEIDLVKSDLLKSQQRVEELKFKVDHLENEVKDKEAKLQQHSNTAEELLQFKNLCISYQERISDLEQERDKIYQQFIKATAESEVSEIINKAVECLHMNETEHLPNLPHPSSFTVQQSTDIGRPTEEDYRLLTDKLRKLEVELETIKTERDKALENIELNVNSSSGAEHSFLPVAVTSEVTQKIHNEHEQLEIDGMPEEAIEVCQQKSFVYGLHYSPLEPTDTMETVDDDDGWGWSANEARLEEEHIQKQQETFSAVDENTVLKTHVVDLENQVRELENEKTKLSEELQAAQIRNAKLLKKLKDFKLKNENLMRENQELALKNAYGVCSLDSAIEEELKIQIDTLEKEVKEYKNEREATKMEKESLLKQIDVLTSANERFLEMKEKQDLEIEMKERINREQKHEIEAYRWKIQELMYEKYEGEAESLKEKHKVTLDNSKIEELEQQIAALAADNENLQMLLEEQRNLRLQLENVCKNNVSVGDQDAEVEKLKLDYQKVKEQYDKASDELNTMSADIQKYITIENEYKQNMGKLCDLEKENTRLIDENQKIVSDLNMHLREKEDIKELQEKNSCAIQEITHQKQQLEEQNVGLANECSTLRHELYNIQEHIESLNTTIDFLKAENEKLSFQIIEKKTDIENLPADLDTQDHMHVVKSEKETETENTYYGKSVYVQTFCTYTTLEELENKVKTLTTALDEKTYELETLQFLLESDRSKHLISEKEMNNVIEQLRSELQTQNEMFLKEKDMKNLESEIQQTSDTENVTKVKNEMTKVIQEYEQMLAEKKQEIHQLQTLLQKKEDTSLLISHKQLEEVIAAKENDIMELQTKLLEKEQKFEECLYAKNQDVENERQRIYETERQMESLIFAKDEDIQNLRIVLAEKERTSNELLCMKDDDIKNLKIKIADKDGKISELTEKLHAELLKVAHLEQKVAELEQKLAFHELEYQSFRLQQAETASNVSDMANISNDNITQEMAEGKQNELDVALYMLHQRDVRCDELTLELMQLLEERDTLQLRLSNSLKVNEELRNKLGRISATSSPDRSVSLSSPGHSLLSSAASLDQTELVPVGQTLVPPQSDETKENLQALAEKLSQLHSVDYRRDVTLKDESEQRHSEQIQLLQHRGSGIVLDASYTLSRDVQSPSTVLLNWIRGRSTPKVMHI